MASWAPARSALAIVAFVVGLGVLAVRAEDRISGTYLMHGPTFVAMLQVSQTDSGQVSGLFNDVALSADGSTQSRQASVAGVVENGQLTLTLRFGATSAAISGAATGSSIALHYVTAQGQTGTWVFTKGTEADFKIYADQLQSAPDAPAPATQPGAGAEDISRWLRDLAKQMSQTMADAGRWADAVDPRLEKISDLERYYERITSQMSAELEKERSTSSPVTRNQLSAAIAQGNEAGIDADLRVNRTWDQLIDEGNAIQQAFAKYPAGCGTAQALEAAGAAQDAIQAWGDACPRMLSEREQFDLAFKDASDQRDALKKFQTGQEQKRNALMLEASQAP